MDDRTDLTRWARETFSEDHFAVKTVGCAIDSVDREHVRCHLDLRPELNNANGVAMGGAIFTLADFTFAIASNVDGHPTVSLSSTIEFLSPGVGGTLHAESRTIRDGKAICFIEVLVTDDDGLAIAKVLSNGFRLPRE